MGLESWEHTQGSGKYQENIIFLPFLKVFLCCSHQWTLGYKGSRQVVAAATLKSNHEAFGGKKPILAPCTCLWPDGHAEVTEGDQDLSPQSCSINPSCQGTFPRGFPSNLIPEILGSSRCLCWGNVRLSRRSRIPAPGLRSHQERAEFIHHHRPGKPGNGQGGASLLPSKPNSRASQPPSLPWSTCTGDSCLGCAFVLMLPEFWEKEQPSQPPPPFGALPIVFLFLKSPS